MFEDQFDMFNGPLDPYTIKLMGMRNWQKTSPVFHLTITAEILHHR